MTITVVTSPFLKTYDLITPSKERAHQTLSFAGCNGLSSYNLIILRTPNTTSLFINLPIECEMCFNAEENFIRKIALHRLLFKHTFHVSTTF